MNEVNSAQIVIGIITCPKYKYRANGIRKTWLKSVPQNIRVLFVYGRPGQPASLEGDLLYLDCPEAYEKLPEKVHKFFSYCADFLEFDYVFKTDDDSFIDVDIFLSFDKHNADYIGRFEGMADVGATQTWHFGKCSDKSYEVPYEGDFKCEWARGGGYFLSSKAVRLLVGQTALAYKEHLFEDKMVGEALTEHNDINILNVHYTDMGVLNPMQPRSMAYLEALIHSLEHLKKENMLLRKGLKKFNLEGGC